MTDRIDVPLVMQWNNADPTVPERFHAIYPGQVRAAGRGALLTVLAPVGSGHCNFTDVQTLAAFNALVSKASVEKH